MRGDQHRGTASDKARWTSHVDNYAWRLHHQFPTRNERARERPVEREPQRDRRRERQGERALSRAEESARMSEGAQRNTKNDKTSAVARRNVRESEGACERGSMLRTQRTLCGDVCGKLGRSDEDGPQQRGLKTGIGIKTWTLQATIGAITVKNGTKFRKVDHATRRVWARAELILVSDMVYNDVEVAVPRCRAIASPVPLLSRSAATRRGCSGSHAADELASACRCRDQQSIAGTGKPTTEGGFVSDDVNSPIFGPPYN